MALHGDVQVNGERLYSWEAVRETQKPETYNWYRVVVFDHSTRDSQWFRVRHKYDDGAVILAAKILARYQAIKERLVK